MKKRRNAAEGNIFNVPLLFIQDINLTDFITVSRIVEWKIIRGRVPKSMF